MCKKIKPEDQTLKSSLADGVWLYRVFIHSLLCSCLAWGEICRETSHPTWLCDSAPPFCVSTLPLSFKKAEVNPVYVHSVCCDVLIHVSAVNQSSSYLFFMQRAFKCSLVVNSRHVGLLVLNLCALRLHLPFAFQLFRSFVSFCRWGLNPRSHPG